MVRDVTMRIHRFCSSNNIFLIFSVFFIIYLVLIDVNDSVVLTKQTLLLHDFYCYATVISNNGRISVKVVESAFHHYTKVLQRCR